MIIWIFIGTGLIFLILGIIIISISKHTKITVRNQTINEKSYQRYGKFYGDLILLDQEFENKINKIYDLVVNQKKTDINEIAYLTNCTYEECILKIKYLKNKRAIDDCYIDTMSGIIKKCSTEDKKLINKYKPFIYGNHYQPNEIALKLQGTTIDNLEKREEEVFEELKYLNEKNLINGIMINEVDKKIIYYSVEKHLKEKEFISINCPSCGALNDIHRGSKDRCEYCNYIIEDKI